MTTQTTVDRTDLVAQLARKKIERDECASRVRSEPEARADLKQLNADISALQQEIADYDAAERATDRQQKANTINETARRREAALENGRAAVIEAGRLAGVFLDALAKLIDARNELRIGEGTARSAGYSALTGEGDRDAFVMEFPLLLDTEIADLLEGAAKGQRKADLKPKVRFRLNQILAQLPGRTE